LSGICDLSKIVSVAPATVNLVAVYWAALPVAMKRIGFIFYYNQNRSGGMHAPVYPFHTSCSDDLAGRLLLGPGEPGL
jgi:hypothetical protein